MEARTDDDGRRHGVRIEVRTGVRIEERHGRRRRCGDDGAVTTPRRRGDDDAGTKAPGRRRDGGGHEADTTMRTRQCGTHSDPHSDPPSILTPILTLPSEEPPRQSSTTFRSSLPSSSLRPSLRSQAGPRSLEVATESESDCHPARRIRCRGRGPRTRNSLACMAAAPIPGPLPSPHREAATNAVNGRVNKVVDLGWKT